MARTKWSEENKLHMVAKLMDEHMLKQNSMLILENSDQATDLYEMEMKVMAKQQEIDFLHEYMDQVEGENIAQRGELRALREELTEIRIAFHNSIEENIKLQRRLYRYESGDSLFFASSSESEHEDRQVRVVRRRLEYDV